MGETTKIEWADATFNGWIGCTAVSPACANCYAERYGERFGVAWGAGKARRRTSPSNWRGPLAWNRAAQKAGVRRRVFSASLSDWLDHEVPVEWLRDLLALVGVTPHLDWLLLSKRVDRWRERVSAAAELGLPGDPAFARALRRWLDGEAHPKNVWLGTTVEDQRRADERIPELLEIPARVRFLSCEPLLGPVNLLDVCGTSPRDGGHPNEMPGLHWIIGGGESGPDARPTHPAWARALRDQAQLAGVAFLWKQWGEWVPTPNAARADLWLDAAGRTFDTRETIAHARSVAPAIEIPEPTPMSLVGKAAAGRELDGRTWDEVPTP